MSKVCIQGLGFVGSAMAVAVAMAENSRSEPIYEVVGVDLPTNSGLQRIASLNNGVFPFPTSDGQLTKSLKKVINNGSFYATVDESVYCDADIIVVDIHLDIPFRNEEPVLEFKEFEQAMSVIGKNAKPGALVVIETTVPPGTCRKIVRPILTKELAVRSLPANSIFLAHSYERVMPGENYLNSIINFWRVFAADDEKSADLCRNFLSDFINVKKYPLTQLSSTLSSETAKVMENTYRAANIAFVDEWTKYAEEVGVDLFEIIDAIKVRPTHSNIKFPGLGVGGYCLTKDPAFTPAAANQLLNKKDLHFPFAKLTIETNNSMPIHVFTKLKYLLNGNFEGTRILVCGISYRQNVGDTRYSPSETLIHQIRDEGSEVVVHDPYVKFWEQSGEYLLTELPSLETFDAVVLCVQHDEYVNLDYLGWLEGSSLILLDANNILSRINREAIRKLGITVESVGRGDGL